ncbi:MAG TPA: hypothetical protein VGV15_13540, partial [Terriglobales bacterium]|nr:hypothetical protein [Terriglobales bacterium]
SNQGLDTVEHVLKNKPNESAESFEAFGIKVPSAVVMRFGILLVIAVQVYFLTHLIELSKRLSPTDPGWEVAWVLGDQLKTGQLGSLQNRPTVWPRT